VIGVHSHVRMTVGLLGRSNGSIMLREQRFKLVSMDVITRLGGPKASELVVMSGPT